MGLYEDNIRLLEDKGIIYTAPAEYKKGYEVCPCKSGDVTIRVNNGERLLYLHSKYNPTAEAEKFAEKLEFSRIAIIICFGIGFGYQIKQLLRKLSDKNKLIIYEPDLEITDMLLKNIDCEEIFSDERVEFLAGTNNADIFYNYIYTSISKEQYTRVRSLVLPIYSELYPQECTDFLKSIKETLRSRITDSDTVKYFLSDWNKNFVKNIPTIINSYNIYNFKNMLKGKPIIVVAAGPSLEKNIHLLKKIKGKVLIIAVYVVAKVMIKHGVLPDMIVTMDSGQIPEREEEVQGLPLFYVSTSNNDLLNKSNGKKVHIFSTLEMFTGRLLHKYKKPAAILALGGSVTCIAAEIANSLMGAAQIIFLGLDLSYPGNKAHVEGTDHKEKTADQIKKGKIYVDDINGEKVLTTETMQTYIQWFERYISKFKSTSTIFIDATEGGALIRGTEISTFEDAINKFCGDGYDVEGMINNAFTVGKMFSVDERLEILRYLISDEDVFKNLLVRIEYAIEQSEKLVKIFRYNANKGRKGVDKIIRSLDEVDGEIKELGTMKELFNLLIDPVREVADRELENEDDDDECVHIAQKSLDMYRHYKKALTETQKYYEEIVPVIKNDISKLENEVSEN